MKKTSIGKEVESTIIKSLQKQGIDLEKNLYLDHNKKIDCIALINDHKVGLQISLKLDLKKAKRAKCCALDVVKKFIYLRVDQSFFCHTKQNSNTHKKIGRELFNLLERIVKENPDENALMVNIDQRTGLRVSSLNN